MSHRDVRKVVGRLLSDDAFRSAFNADSASALQPFDLTPSEAVALQDIDLTEFDSTSLEVARDLDSSAIKVHSITIG